MAKKDTIVLTLNCGSSSVKYQLYNWDMKTVLCKGAVERVIIGGSFIRHEVPGKKPVTKEEECADHKEAIQLIIKTILSGNNPVLKDLSNVQAVGHRVVHGGDKFTKSIRIDEKMLEVFEELKDLAPLHNPPNITGIKAARELMPDIPHIAVMDTAFLQTLPPSAYIYAVPYEWYEQYKIRRYGFHGTSHLYVSRRAAVLLKKPKDKVNLITCHIGNGVSFTAIKNGKPIDHSMGFTPLEGLVMGTRSGDIDPAIIGYISEKEGFTALRIVSILNRKSGIYGITGQYTDRRDVVEAIKKGDERAKLAFDIEAYRIKKYIGAYVASIGKVDAIVFTAGAGEKSYELREAALAGLEHFGIKLDTKENTNATSRNKETVISSDDSEVKVFVIPTDEEMVFTEDVVAILKGTYTDPHSYVYSFEDPHYKNKMREEAYKKERRPREQNHKKGKSRKRD
jgi:acetate kinase